MRTIIILLFPLTSYAQLIGAFMGPTISTDKELNGPGVAMGLNYEHDLNNLVSISVRPGYTNLTLRRNITITDYAGNPTSNLVGIYRFNYFSMPLFVSLYPYKEKAYIGFNIGINNLFKIRTEYTTGNISTRTPINSNNYSLYLPVGLSIGANKQKYRLGVDFSYQVPFIGQSSVYDIKHLQLLIAFGIKI